jgi:hypothetical protein
MQHSQIYVLVGELHMKIMQKEHDLPCQGTVENKPQEWP